jgi:exo-beta-1,3-glucanase (GH17 family)
MRAAFLLMFLLAAGCGGETPSREEPFVLRPLTLADGEDWPTAAICYGPHRDGQHPGGPSPSAAELREDLRLMAPRWNLLRIYGSSGFARSLLEIIRADALDMKVMLGAWIAPDDVEGNRREVATAIELANAFPGIVLAVSVGNETQVSWSAHRCPPDLLIGHLQRVRAGVTVPVTTADDFKFWTGPESRAVAAEVDFITVHAHPLWNGRRLDEALAWLSEQVAAVQALHPARPVVLGETGWATSVHDQGEQAELIKGRAGEAEQQVFYGAVTAWADSAGLVTFWFEAFDENWKGGPHPAEVEKHWGLFRADRTPKAALAARSGD